MRYVDYVAASDGEYKVICLAPGFSRLKKGDLVQFPASGWLKVLAVCTLPGDNEVHELIRSCLGATPKINAMASVREVDGTDFKGDEE